MDKILNDNNFGKLVKNSRIQKKIKPMYVYQGICSESVYSRIESGDFNVDFHIKRAVLQRLGIDEGRAGVYLSRKSCVELDMRNSIVEDIAGNMLVNAKEKLELYNKKYGGKSRLNCQFIYFVEARLNELNGSIKEAYEKYESAIKITVPQYRDNYEFECISVYEAYIICNVARLMAVNGEISNAEKIYKKLMNYCKNDYMDIWTKSRLYPAVLCGLLDIVVLERLSRLELMDYTYQCYLALKYLRIAGKTYFIVKLLENIKKLNIMCGNIEDIECSKFQECFSYLFTHYNVSNENYEWYPYYIEGRYYPIEELISERRIIYGITMEELAGLDCDVTTISRVLNGKSSARISTLNKLLDKIGFTSTLDSDMIVSDDVEIHELWDELVNAFSGGNINVAEDLYEIIEKKINHKIDINKMALRFIRNKLDYFEEKINLKSVMEKYLDILPFEINNIDKCKYYTIIEHDILNSYMDCLKKVDAQNCKKYIEFLYNHYTDDIDKKKNISVYEGILQRYGSILGDLGKYEESDMVLNQGIIIELQCSRTYALKRLLYDMVWNNSQKGTLSVLDKRICEYAAIIAHFNMEYKREQFYRQKEKLFFG